MYTFLVCLNFFLAFGPHRCAGGKHSWVSHSRQCYRLPCGYKNGNQASCMKNMCSSFWAIFKALNIHLYGGNYSQRFYMNIGFELSKGVFERHLNIIDHVLIIWILKWRKSPHIYKSEKSIYLVKQTSQTRKGILAITETSSWMMLMSVNFPMKNQVRGINCKCHRTLLKRVVMRWED